MVNKLFGAKPFVRELCFINSKRYCSGSNHRRCSVKKYVLETFANFTGKHLCWSFLSIKLQASDCNFTKKEILAQVFFYKICEILRTPFFTEHLRATASVVRSFLRHFPHFRTNLKWEQTPSDVSQNAFF